MWQGLAISSARNEGRYQARALGRSEMILEEGVSW